MLTDAELDDLADRVLARLARRIDPSTTATRDGTTTGRRRSPRAERLPDRLGTRAAAKLLRVRQVDLAALAERAAADGIAERIGQGSVHVHYRWPADADRLRAWLDGVKRAG